MTNEKELNLIQKIASVQAGLGEVAKEGHNKIQNYDYVTEAQVKKLIRQPLAKLGVIINPQFEIKNEWNETTKKVELCIMPPCWEYLSSQTVIQPLKDKCQGLVWIPVIRQL